MKRVRAKWIMKLPTASRLAVSMGSSVAAGDLLAEVREFRHKSIDMAKSLAKISPEEVEKLKQKLPIEVTAGEVLVGRQGWFGKELVAPESGLLVRIDEFGNFIYRSETGEVRRVVSPVSGKVLAGEEKAELIVSFHARQFNGTAKGEGKKWSQGAVMVDGVEKINSSMAGKMAVVEKLDQTVAVKLEVVGATGFIVKEEGEVKSDLPIFCPDVGEFEKILGVENLESKQLLLNSSDGRLMIVI